MAFGTGAYRYDVVDLWAKRPKGWTFIDVVGVAVDAKDNVYVFSRGPHPVMVFDHDGIFQFSFGEGIFTRPHGITIGKDGFLYCTDDKDHTVRKFSPEGRLVRTWGKPNVYTDTGYDGADYKSIKRGAGPFNRPTKVAFGPKGDMYVSDGYGNARIHKFSAKGDYVLSWGEPGDKPGQFNLPHAVEVDAKGRVYVCDRQNNRIEIFDADGKYLTTWGGFLLPTDMFVTPEQVMFVSELTHRVSIVDLDGKVLARWGSDKPNQDAGGFVSPHGIAVDSRGDFYVGEVCETNRSIDRGARALQKFVKVK